MVHMWCTRSDANGKKALCPASSIVDQEGGLVRIREDLVLTAARIGRGGGGGGVDGHPVMPQVAARLTIAEVGEVVGIVVAVRSRDIRSRGHDLSPSRGEFGLPFGWLDGLLCRQCCADKLKRGYHRMCILSIEICVYINKKSPG